MILMLNKLTSEYGVTITNNNDEENKFVTINWNTFQDKVNVLEMRLLEEKKEKEKKDVTDQMRAINNCLKSGIKNFTIDYPGSSGSNDMINFTIEIHGYNTTGGRRSKARRTKKGPRKGKTAKKRGHWRS